MLIHILRHLKLNPARLRGNRDESLIKMSSPCMCLAGHRLLRLLTDAPPHFNVWPCINIEMRIMHKSLHSDYVSPPFLLLPQTASTVLSFSRWHCQLIHFQVLHRGDPFCLSPGPLTIHPVLFSSSANLPHSLLI